MPEYIISIITIGLLAVGLYWLAGVLADYFN